MKKKTAMLVLFSFGENPNFSPVGRAPALHGDRVFDPAESINLEVVLRLTLKIEISISNSKTRK